VKRILQYEDFDCYNSLYKEKLPFFLIKKKKSKIGKSVVNLRGIEVNLKTPGTVAEPHEIHLKPRSVPSSPDYPSPSENLNSYCIILGLDSDH
jgi:hypothetical protein